MTPRPLPAKRAAALTFWPRFWFSAAAGAYGGTALMLAARFLAGGAPLDSLEDVGVALAVLFGFGALTTPFVSVGLAVFALPLTRPLRRHASRPWAGPLAAALGGVAGKLSYDVVDQVLFNGQHLVLRLGNPDTGLCYGVAAGLGWWRIGVTRGVDGGGTGVLEAPPPVLPSSTHRTGNPP